MLELPAAQNLPAPRQPRQRKALVYGVLAGLLVLLLAASAGVGVLSQENRAVTAKVNALAVDLASAQSQLDQYNAKQGSGLTDEQIKSSLNDQAVSNDLLTRRVDDLEAAVGGLSGDGSSLSQRVSTLELSVGSGSSLDSRLSAVESDISALDSRLGSAEKAQRLTDVNVSSVTGSLRSMCQSLRSSYSIYVYC